MNLPDLINRISGESSLPKKQVRDILISSFKILKEAIKEGEVDEVVFRSPVFNISRKIIPKVLPTEEKKGIPSRKRGIIQLRNQ